MSEIRVRLFEKYLKFKIRRCKSLHYCEECQKDIIYGQTYFDGGYGKRAHTWCVLGSVL